MSVSGTNKQRTNEELVGDLRAELAACRAREAKADLERFVADEALERVRRVVNVMRHSTVGAVRRHGQSLQSALDGESAAGSSSVAVSGVVGE